MSQTLKLLLIDDHTLFRAGMRMLLDQHPRVKEIYEAASITSKEQTESPDIDLIFLDIDLPGINGLDGIRILHEQFPLVPIIILSASDDTQAPFLAASKGAQGYLAKTATVSDIHNALDICISGKQFFPDIHNNTFISNGQTRPDLTSRQLDVLSELCQGKSNKLIAYHLGLSENTVRVHVSAILQSLGVSSRSEAILRAQKIGLVR